jgi:thiamine biosynthesis protein ThiS
VQLVINGETRQVGPSGSQEGGLRIDTLVALLGLQQDHVAIELNGSLVLRAARAETAVTDGDRLEIVTLVGGG